MHPIKAPSQAGIVGLAHCGTIEGVASQVSLPFPWKALKGRDGSSVSALAVRDQGICITP